MAINVKINVKKNSYMKFIYMKNTLLNTFLTCLILLKNDIVLVNLLLILVNWHEEKLTGS